MRELKPYGLNPQKPVFWDTPSPLLVERTLLRGEGILVHRGALAVDTTPYTGRSPKDKFLVKDSSTEGEVDWGEINQPFAPEDFQALQERVADYLSQQELYVQNLYVGTDRAYRIGLRLVSESPWHALFARNLFLLLRRFEDEELDRTSPEFVILHAPYFQAQPERDHTRSEAFIGLDLTRRIILIVGTRYAGEIKKSMFSVMNYLMPTRGVLPMHCSANVGPEGDVALFFGLSGTGKTTLSTHPQRRLIGDDEHGWSPQGIFNFEGGCYAKTIRLSKEQEPLIWEATNRFESILENVVVNPESRRVEWDDDSKTENTRSAYPLAHLSNAVPSGMAGHPRHLFFLSADAYGVLPPIARLNPEQAMYFFLSGYTARVAGTERGVSEPRATFSSCFGAPFWPRSPLIYARLLGERLRQYRPHVWLVNTGWIGGAYGVGRRIPLEYTRRLLEAALGGELDRASYREDPVFGFEVPERVSGVPEEVLWPSASWSDPSAYAAQQRRLALLFQENFRRFAGAEEFSRGGPRLG